MEPVYFPPAKAGNIVRGAFGIHFREVAEARRKPALFDRIFQPALEEKAGPSGLADLPRPFVFRASHLDGRNVPRGASFHFDLNLFDTRESATEAFTGAFARVAEAGLGPGRAKARLTSVDERPVQLSLIPRKDSVRRAVVRFLTPTEMKSDGRTLARPEFPVLLARIRDRVSTLRALYGPGPLAIDFRALADHAADVRLTRCDIERRYVDRRSTRTGLVHPIGGFVGEVEYEGEMREFIPYLEAAQWTGVGRHTVWGNGVISVTILPS